MALNPKYTNGLPGRDWDILNTTLDDTVIPEIEKDAVAMIRHLGNDSRQINDCWLFKAGGIAALFGDEERELCNRFVDKLQDSNNWILTVTAKFSHLYRIKIAMITLEAMGGNADQFSKNTLAELMRSSGMRKAESALENELIDVLISSLPNLLELSPEGLSQFKGPITYSDPNRGGSPTPAIRKEQKPVHPYGSGEKERPAKKTSPKSPVAVIAVIAAILAGLFLLLKGLALVPPDTCSTVAMFCGVIISTIACIIGKKNDWELGLVGWIVTWFVIYIVGALLIILIFMGAHALSGNGMAVWEAFTAE